MFYHIAGEYIHAEENFVVVDCGGVGYRLTVSRTTSDTLGMPAEGKRAKLYTYLQVREDDVELFGFHDEEELAAFRMLIAVSGVGPKAAMAVLSLLTPEKLALAVATEDTKAISRASGVGAKTAARIVLELHDKYKGVLPSAAAVPKGEGAVADAPAGGKLSEAAEALTVLGYGRAEVTDALRRVGTPTMSVEEMITAALKYFSKS